MLETYYISHRFFTENEIQYFKTKFGYFINEIDYTTSMGEIDFSKKDEKQFLFKNGYPKILARFFAN